VKKGEAEKRSAKKASAARKPRLAESASARNAAKAKQRTAQKK
jgi:hypothetical protein